MKGRPREVVASHRWSSSSGLKAPDSHIGLGLRVCLGLIGFIGLIGFVGLIGFIGLIGLIGLIGIIGFIGLIGFRVQGVGFGV